MSIWKKIAEMAPSEPVGFEDLPPGVWLSMETATTENGEAAPKIQTRTAKESQKDFFIFKVGLLATGGETSKTNIKHKGGMVFYEAFVEASQQQMEENPDAVLGGKFTGFLNCVFASGVGNDVTDPEERAVVRWGETARKLEAAGNRKELTPEQFGDNVALFIAGCAVAAMEDTHYPILVKTKKKIYKRKDDPVGGKMTGEKIVAGTVEDSTPNRRANRNINLFEPLLSPAKF